LNDFKQGDIVFVEDYKEYCFGFYEVWMTFGDKVTLIYDYDENWMEAKDFITVDKRNCTLVVKKENREDI
jgi:hypothetical protein